MNPTGVFGLVLAGSFGQAVLVASLSLRTSSDCRHQVWLADFQHQLAATPAPAAVAYYCYCQASSQQGQWLADLVSTQLAPI
jgi:hypothetical protein